jgi:hypothetical protein
MVGTGVLVGIGVYVGVFCGLEINGRKADDSPLVVADTGVLRNANKAIIMMKQHDNRNLKCDSLLFFGIENTINKLDRCCKLELKRFIYFG